jgi:hypothetical protein
MGFLFSRSGAGVPVTEVAAGSGVSRQSLHAWVPGPPTGTTFHDLRHTFTSTALAEGVPVSEVSRWLGHKPVTTTVDLHGHLVPEASGQARDALDRAFALAAMCPQKCPGHLLTGFQPQVSAIQRGEPACRPGLVQGSS